MVQPFKVKETRAFLAALPVPAAFCCAVKKKNEDANTSEDGELGDSCQGLMKKEKQQNSWSAPVAPKTHSTLKCRSTENNKIKCARCFLYFASGLYMCRLRDPELALDVVKATSWR